MADVLVNNTAALAAAIKNAKAGDVIKLAPGNYGEIYLAGKSFSSAVTFVSADPSNPAHVDRILLSGSKNLVFQSLDIGRGLKAGETASGWNSMVRISASSDLVFDGVKIHGSLDGDSSNDPMGFYMSDSSNVTLRKSELVQLGTGLGFDRSSNLKIVGNTIHELNGDGMNFAQVNNVLIDDNKITDFYHVPGQHPDAIQFWTVNTKAASSDIVIRNNVILQGKGMGMQGIFMTDQMGDKTYKNVVIENNLVYTNFSNGITVQNAANATIRNNTAVSTTKDAVNTRIWLAGIQSGTASGNVSDSFAVKDNTALTLSNNISFLEKSSLSKALIGLNDGVSATAARLVMGGAGYQLTTSTAPVPSVPINEPSKPTTEAPSVPVTPVPSSSAKLLLGVSFDGGRVSDASSYGTKFTGNFNTADVVSTPGGEAYHLTGKNGFGAARGTDAQIFGLDKFTLSFSLKRDSATSGTGDIMRVHSNWRLYMAQTGELVFEFTDRNKKSLTYVIKGTKLADTKWHDIDLSFDATKGMVSFFVDAKQVGQTAVATGTKPMEFWDFYVGNPYGSSVQAQIGDIRIRNDALTGVQIAAEGSWLSSAKTAMASATPVASSAAKSMSYATEFAPTSLGATLESSGLAATTTAIGAAPLGSVDLAGMLGGYGTSDLTKLLYHA